MSVFFLYKSRIFIKIRLRSAKDKDLMNLDRVRLLSGNEILIVGVLEMRT
jgi:hypothetical protein